MSLTPEQVRKLKDAFNTWAKNNPDIANEPVVILVPSGKTYSPNQIVEGMKKNNNVGKDFIDCIDVCVSSGTFTLDEMITQCTPPKFTP